MPNLGICRCCSGEVSDEAHICPHCGQPAPFKDLTDLYATVTKNAKNYLANGKEPLDVIRYVRDATELGLKEAGSSMVALQTCLTFYRGCLFQAKVRLHILAV